MEISWINLTLIVYPMKGLIGILKNVKSIVNFYFQENSQSDK